ncbi:MAG: carboxypeptidase regulatory-like domain-containing protein [Planctomycetes bacterium]|nr:carboxypeptidase regulatory-like domain-containing protein [Planctomycetota bacterium]
MHWSLPPLFGCLSFLLPAQDQRPLIGRVVDAAGEPVAGAEVTVAWSGADQPELASTTTANGEADGRGYFKIQAPVGRRLWVWAIGKNDEAGKYAASEVIDCVVGMPRLQVVVDKDLFDRPIQVTGLDGWPELAPFTLRYHLVPFLDLAVDLPLDAQGACRPPRRPHTTSWVQLLDARGNPWLCERANEGDLKLPAAQSLPIEVVDDAGKPVADAEILHRIGDLRDWSARYGSTQRECWQVVGKTDADGKAIVKVALAEDPLQAEKPRDLLLMARKNGHAPSHGGFDEKWFLDGVQLGDGEKPKAFKFTLAKAEPLTGVLALPGTRPPAVLVRWTSKIKFQNGWTHLDRSERLPVAADGTIAVALPSDAYQVAFFAPPVELVAEDGRRRLVPVVLPTVGETRTGRVELGGAKSVKFTIASADGSPLGAMQVLACNEVNGNLATSPAAAVLQVSASGSGEVLVASAGAWLLAFGEQGYAFARLADPAASSKVELKLEPFAAVRGQVVDDQGQPVPGARVSVHRTSSRGGMRGADGMVLDTIASLARSQMDRVVTDAEGKFVMRFLPRPGLTMQARASKGGKQTESFAVEEGAEVSLVWK